MWRIMQVKGECYPPRLKAEWAIFIGNVSQFCILEVEDSHNQFGMIKSDIFILQTPSLPKKVDKFKNYMRSSFKMTDEGVSCLL